MIKRLLLGMGNNLICQQCHASLTEARWISVVETNALSVFHVTCSSCKNQFIVTADLSGVGLTPYHTDLTGMEFIDFLGKGPVTKNDLLDLHQLIKDGSLWNLLLTKETLKGKKSKSSVPKAACRV